MPFESFEFLLEEIKKQTSTDVYGATTAVNHGPLFRVIGIFLGGVTAASDVTSRDELLVSS